MLRLRRPVVIVDEAHNARTELSFSTLGNLLPSCVIEFTATPDRTRSPSNVLHHVSAAELKAEEMVKLPLKVVSRHPSQADQLLAEALNARENLEKLAIAEAQATGEYIRPILLIQAERVDACAPLKHRLATEHGIPEEQIKISVGTLNELDGIADVSSPKCSVRYIITVQKLREGWDCPFAYVLCNLKETRSATAIEQIVGRILRLPGAKLKRHEDLNCSYAFSVSPSIEDVLKELRDALESNGFSKEEAEQLIVTSPAGTLPLGFQAQTVKLEPKELEQALVALSKGQLAGKVKVDEDRGELKILVPLDAKEEEKLLECVPSPAAKEKVAATVELVRQRDRAFGGSGTARAASPYEQNFDFMVPLLAVQEANGTFVFEETYLLEYPWRLSEKEASLRPSYNPLERPFGKAGILDITAKGDLTEKVMEQAEAADFVATLHQHTLALGAASEWTVDRLVAWLDSHIEHTDISVAESAEFLRKVIRGLMTKLAVTDLGTLVIDRYRLRDEIERRIKEHRDAERTAAMQQFLLPESPLTVTQDVSINFRSTYYAPSEFYGGSFQFKKHYYPKVGELTEKTPSGQVTEEFKCAQFIDGLEEVEYWVRNLVKKPTSFRLRTSKDWFYPDFVCQLKDGRALVVEYKGAHLYADAEEKRAIGAVWEVRSQGKCLFIMPTDEDFTSIERKIRG
jgi:type III restriction enzyme